MDNEKIILEKDGFVFTKLRNNCYNMTFSIENNKILLPNIINFDLIKLMYDLNPDIYEFVELDKINNDNAYITFVIKHLFQDVGVSQKYSHLQLTRTTTDKLITICAHTLPMERPANVPIQAELLKIDTIECVCNIENPHKIFFTYNVIYENTQNIQPYAEKIIGIISNKVFKRLKRFIENVNV